MYTFPVQIYIYELSPESRSWCRDQFKQILSDDEVVLHTSVVVHGVEYSYGENGLEAQEPKLRPQYEDDDFEEAVTRFTTVGTTKFTKTEVEKKIEMLRKNSSWLFYKFNPIEHNCHHFSEMLVKMLCGEAVSLPDEVDEFNKQLLLDRDLWIDKFYEEPNSEGTIRNLDCLNTC